MVFNVGPLNMTTEPVKNFLEGLAVRRKAKYASLLHERARVRNTVNQYAYVHVRAHTHTHTRAHMHIYTRAHKYTHLNLDIHEIS